MEWTKITSDPATLPPENEKVLTLDRRGHTHDRRMRVSNHGDGEPLYLFSPDGLIAGRGVTHWMPLPDMPDVKRYWLPVDGMLDYAQCPCCGEVYTVTEDEPSVEIWRLFGNVYRYCPQCGQRLHCANMKEEEDA